MVYVEDIPGVTMPKKTPKLQIVTIQEIPDGATMNLPLPIAVVESAERHKRKDDERKTDFAN